MSWDLELKAWIRRLVRRETLYLVTYSAVVQQQHDDDTIDVLPDDERVRGNGLQRVQIRHGLPGVRVRVRQGSTVLLSWENGNPKRPYAAMWEPSAIESIAFDGGTRPVARKGDPVALYWPSPLSISGTLGTVPFTGTITVLTTSPGIIQGGKDNVLA